MIQRRSARAQGIHFNNPVPWKMNLVLLKSRTRSIACKTRHFPIDVFVRSLATPLAGQAGGIFHLPWPADNESANF